MAEEIGFDCYNLLGVQKGATADEIQKAWRSRALTAHPDKKGGTDEWMKNLNKAKTILLDPEKRAKYDDEYEPGEDITDIKVALNIGEKLSESFKTRIDDWVNEFPNFTFIDNFDNGKIYNDAFKQIQQASRDLLKIENDFQCQSEKELSIYEIQYHNHMKQYEKENLNSKLMTAFSEFWQLDKVKVSFSDLLWGLSHDRSNEGDTHFEAGRYTEALSWYIISKKQQVVKDRAYELFRRKSYDDAKLYFIALYKKDPSTESIVMMLTAATLQSGFEDRNLAEAIRTAAVKCNDPLLNILMIRLLYIDQMHNEVVGAALACGRSFPRFEPGEDVLCLFRDSKEFLEKETLQVIRDWLYKYSGNKDGFLKKISDRLYEHGSSLLKQLHDELTTGIDTSQLSLRYQVSLLIFKGYLSEREKKFKESLRAYQDAVILLPTEEVHSSVASLLNINHIKAMIDSLEEQLREIDMPIPVSHQYFDRFKGNANIRAAMKYEKAVLNGKRCNLTAALLYIDLCMSSFDTSMLCSNFMLASAFFLQEMKQFQFVSEQRYNNQVQVQVKGTDRVALSLMYALRNAIRDLCITTLTRARKHEHPITELYFVKLSFILSKLSNDLFRAALNASGQLNRSNGNKPVLEKVDEALPEILTRSLIRLVKVTPFCNIQMCLSTDFLYLDAVGTEFLEVYYNKNTGDNPRSYKYQYELLELAWKCLPFSDGGWKFEQYRQAALISLLKQHPSWNINQVYSLMQWSVLNRDEEGFLDPNRPWLNLPGENFDSIDGVYIDVEGGVFHLLMTPTPQPGVFQSTDKMKHSGLFNMADVLEVLKMGITSSFFTLNQADFDMHSHPFQEMRFLPKHTYNSNFLATQLHADMLLKYLSTGVEVSAKFPFAFRPTAEKLINALPEVLREFVTPTSERNNGSKIGDAHRFWIECGKLTYDESFQGTHKLFYLFGKCPMKVKTHLLKYNAEGEAIDDDDADNDPDNHSDSDGTEFDVSDLEDDDDDDFCYNCREEGSDCRCPTDEDDAEKEFADDMTLAYTCIGRFYRVFLRLRELYKLQAVWKLLNHVYNKLEDAKKSVSIDMSPIESAMSELHSKVRGYTITEKNINDVASNLKEVFHITNDSHLRSLISDCLKYGRSADLAQHIRTFLEKREKEKLSRFGSYCNKLGLNFDNLEVNHEMNDPNGSDCIWVPSAFYRNFPKRVYGGVNMALRLKEHTVDGTKGNPNAFKSSVVRSVDGKAGYFDSRNIKSQINDRASTVASKSFSGKSSNNFRPKSDGGVRNGGNNNKSNNPSKSSKNTSRGMGPSGEAKIHVRMCSSRKKAYDAAKAAGGGMEPIRQYDELAGWHYHPVSQKKIHDVKSGKHTADLRRKGNVTQKSRHYFPNDESKHGQTGGTHFCFNAPNIPGRSRVKTHKELEKLRKLRDMKEELEEN